jgi:hypothetical protein
MGRLYIDPNCGLHVFFVKKKIEEKNEFSNKKNFFLVKKLI